MEGLIMKLPTFAFSFALAILATTSTAYCQQKPLDYKTAYELAQKGDKPLLVLVTATWCPPCQMMKQTTIPTLLKKQAFKDCHWATVDFDKEKALAQQLTDAAGVPQLIMFEKRNGKWVRRYLRGYKKANVVEAFVAQSKTIRTAQAQVTTNKVTK